MQAFPQDWSETEDRRGARGFLPDAVRRSARETSFGISVLPQPPFARALDGLGDGHRNYRLWRLRGYRGTCRRADASRSTWSSAEKTRCVFGKVGQNEVSPGPLN